MNKIILIDFSGTLTSAFVAEEANLKRYEILGIPKPSNEEHKKMHGTKAHYDVIKKVIENNFGINDAMKVKFVQNYNGEVELTGKDIKTIIMTDLFRNAMYLVAAEHKMGIFEGNIIGVLEELRKKGYKLAIISGTRTDIITGVMQIAGCSLEFDYILGQDPVLSRDDKDRLYEKISDKGKVEFVIGDKIDDLKPANKFNAKSVFVKWGHPTGGEEQFADFVIEKPEEFKEIIK